MDTEPPVTNAMIGGRLIPRSLFASNESTAEFVDAMRFIIDHGGAISGVSFNVSKAPAYPNSVNPWWRESILNCVVAM